VRGISSHGYRGGLEVVPKRHVFRGHWSIKCGPNYQLELVGWTRSNSVMLSEEVDTLDTFRLRGESWIVVVTRVSEITRDN
jgi:hypothetical protein